MMHTLFLALASMAAAADLPLATVPERLEATLDNGLVITVVADPILARQVLVHRVGVGSAHEGVGEHGLAHLVEHMMFQGTEAVPEQRWWQLRDDHGAELNAFTGFDATTYYSVVPTEAVVDLVAMEQDRFAHFEVEATELDREVGVVLDELRFRRSLEPRPRVRAATRELLLEGHPYGRAIAGDPSSLEALSTQAVEDFQQRHYGAVNLRLVAVGPLDAAALLALLCEHYSELPRGAVPPAPSAVTDLPLPRRLTHRDPGLRTRENGVAWAIPPTQRCPTGDEGQACVQAYWSRLVLLSSFDDGGASAVATRLRTSLGWYAPVHIESWSGEQGGLVTVYARRANPAFVWGRNFAMVVAASRGIVMRPYYQPSHALIQRAVREGERGWIDEHSAERAYKSVLRQSYEARWDPLARALAIAGDPLGRDPGHPGAAEGLAEVQVAELLDLYEAWFVQREGVMVHVR
jgi:predicted Zn-dependent peptidase